jgi:restriction system protein
MARRKENILDDLAKAPWWVSVVLAAGTFIVLRFIIPLLTPAGPATASNYALKGVLGAAPVMAPFVAFVLLIPAPIAAYRQWRERRLLDQQEGLESIRGLSWREFETLMAEAFRRQGYAVYRPSGTGPDGGVDLVLKKYGVTRLVQCKQWKAWKVGVKVIRELYGVMTARKAHGAILVTSGIFTQDARTFAVGKPIDLVEGPQLAALIRAVQQPSAPEPAVARSPSPAPPRPAPVRVAGPAAEPSDAPPQAPVASRETKRCPKCGSAMVLRTAQRGPQAGQQFWGCSQFPRCRATEPAAN